MVRRLFADIEVSPNRAYIWGAGYKLNVGYNSITEERSIICICWKWENEKEIGFLNWRKPGDDKKMVKDFINVMKEAEEVVFHNGDKFDLPWVRTRALFHELDMPIGIKTIDTLKVARRHFRFNSNRLDYLAQYLGIGAKIKTDYDLWKGAMAGDQSSLDKMVKYCKGDVKLLEQVYKRLKNHIPAKTHHGVQIGKDRGSCPECGSSEVIINKYRISAAGRESVAYQCRDCGKYHQKPYSNVKQTNDVKDSRRSKARP